MYRVCKAMSIWLIMLLVILPFVSSAKDEQPLFSKQELEQMVAPIALYPDPLLAQILMASTYPLEVVSAARWVKENPTLKDKALEDALQKQSWDPSVKSLTAVPDVLNTMNDKLEMTAKLGDAFLGQQNEVLDAIQALRHKAEAEGKLKSGKEQVVKNSKEAVVPQSNTTEQTSDTITILQADPDVVYVPTYDPNVIYGSWPYSDYPPDSYYPESYYPVGGLLAFGAAIAVGNALWGEFDWRNHGVNINVNRYNNLNRDRITNGRWEHHVEHRGGVPYRDRASQDRFDRNQIQNTQAREAFRGRAEQGRQEIAKGGQGAMQRMENQGQRREQGLDSNRERVNSLDNKRVDNRQPNRAPKATQRDQRPNSFDGINNGKQVRHASNRGANSRSANRPQHHNIQRGGGNRGGMNRGGGHRGGGGGRGGGGRRR